MKSSLIISTIFLLFFAGCGPSSEESVPTNNESQQEVISTPENPEEDARGEENPEREVTNIKLYNDGIIGVKGEDIILHPLEEYAEKIGETREGRLCFEKTRYKKGDNGDLFPSGVISYSFEADLETIRLSIDDWVTNQDPFIIYNEDMHTWTSNSGSALEIPIEEITFSCDGPLAYEKGVEEQLPSFYCETNGEDFLEQYEFNSIPVQLGTGGGFAEYWKKIYIRKIDGENFVFMGALNGEGAHDRGKEYNTITPSGQEEYEKYANKAYLDQILADPENQERIASWDAFVESFRIESITEE